MNRALLRAGGVLCGLLAGGGALAIGADLLSSIGLGLVAAVAGVMTIAYRDRMPSETEWEVTRWNGAFIGVTMGGTFLGLNNGLGITSETTLVLQLLVLAIAWTSLLMGVVIVHEQRALRSSDGDTSST